jgi:hypothetical protein
MIPLVAVVSLRNRESRTFRLWVPLILVWLVIVPLMVLLSPLIVVASLICRINPFQGFAVVWQILSALRETEFDFDRPSAGVSICIL